MMLLRPSPCRLPSVQERTRKELLSLHERVQRKVAVNEPTWRRVFFLRRGRSRRCVLRSTSKQVRRREGSR